MKCTLELDFSLRIANIFSCRFLALDRKKFCLLVFDIAARIGLINTC